MNDISGLVIDTFEILKENGVDNKTAQSVLFDFLVSMENHMFIEGEDAELEDCFNHDIDLDKTLEKYFDSIKNPDDYEDADEEFE